jgi:integrase
VDYHSDGLVFPALRGGAIDDHAFSQRAWKKVLQLAGIEHRVFNSARHTFVSHALRKLEPMKVAELAGHNQQTLFKHYAAGIGSAALPELWD